ncbi:MAG TPA: proline--tRNA ligase [Candidatus Norongarragalinales archaeon]|jgi:prolyl-tRNA synthetase|nr:proline--tRNA ligase [Candidatus Norongarragalinales archaeon]
MAMMASREFDKDKNKDYSEWYNTILYAADLVDNRYNVQGFIVHKPNAAIPLRKVTEMIERELEDKGHSPVMFPVVIPEENFEKEKEHAQGFKLEVFWVTHAGNEKLARRLALRPTSETAMYQMYSLWIQSKSQLPLKLYQSCNVYRNESETNPFLRGREFSWIEAHDVFDSKDHAARQIEEDMAITHKVLTDQLGLALLAIKRPQWDKFPGADDTYGADVILPDGKALQIATTHMLGQRFAKAFGVKFQDENGKDQFAWQTCYGPGTWRMMGALIGVHGDNKGLLWPMSIAPTQVVIVPIMKTGAPENAKILDTAKSLFAVLKRAGFRAALDDSDKTPGYKYSKWELIGTPARVEIGAKEVKENNVTLARRDTGTRLTIPQAQIVGALTKLSAEMLDSMKEKTQNDLSKRIEDADTKQEVLKILEKKGVARAPFHSTDDDGAKCAEELQTFTKGGKVRGTRFGMNEKPSSNAKCVVCGKPAKQTVYIARQY